jgi:hypothetical protein
MTASAPSALLNLINIGSPVAEYDEALSNYFVETATFEKLIGNKGDIVAGDKGTGKTALFRILKDQFAEHEALGDVEVVSAFNPAGTPNFQRLIDSGELSESGYIAVWKSYLFMLAGNWLLELHDNSRPGSLGKLEDILERSGLRSTDNKPSSLFARIVNFISTTQIETSASFTPEGIPIFLGKISRSSDMPPEEKPVQVLRYDEALAFLEECLQETDFTLWLVFDRLDEAFQASPAYERPALRALLRTYLDIQELSNLRMKLFLRNDLFLRIIEGGFVNLTHINARKIPITWDDDDLYVLLYRRIKESGALLAALELDESVSADDLFRRVFPVKVDDTSKRPTTWNWILTRIRDGNNVKSPRNLVDLVIKAVDAQIRREAQSPRVLAGDEALLTGEALKTAHAELSSERVSDTLLAEAGDSATYIKLFENGKAEQNDNSLSSLFGADSTAITKRLVALGFLEKIGQTYKVPMLYRQGLAITQGKAWNPDDSESQLPEDPE